MDDAAVRAPVVPAARSEPEPDRLVVSRFLVDVARRVGATLDLSRTLDQVVEAVVELLGFGLAALNLVTAEGDLEVVSVAGPDEVRRELLGTRTAWASWESLLASARPYGGLRFADAGLAAAADMTFWVPPGSTPHDDDDAWRPEDALFAPLHGADGRLLGVLSVDLPPRGRRPDAHTCQLLELFVFQASLALDHVRVHGELQRSQAVFQRAFEHSPIGMAVYDARRLIVRANPAYCRLLGRPVEELVGHPIRDFSHPDDIELVDRASADVRAAGAGVTGVERRYLRPDGSVVWGRLSLIVLDGNEDGEQVLAHVEDITQSRAAAAELELRASSDPLTGLANRHTFERLLEARLAEPGRGTAVLFCDVDRFKAVNDTLGHAAGDDLLQLVAAEITAVLRGQDLAARLGGDEFVLLLDGVSTSGQALRVAERLRLAVRRVVAHESRSLAPSMTIGVALSEPGVSGKELLAMADRALYRAKALGRDRVALSGATSRAAG